MLSTLYHFFTWLFYPLWVAYTYWRSYRGKENPARISERFGYASIDRPHGILIWIHAASVGESLSVLPVIHHITCQHADAHILLTTGTVTSAAMIQNQHLPRTLHQFSPLDTPQTVGRFLRSWHPDLALWVESDLWPTLLKATHKRQIPILLINGRLSDTSFRRWKWMRLFLKNLLTYFATIYPQSEEQANRFTFFGATKLKTPHNLKFAAAPLQVEKKAAEDFLRALGDRPVWLAASTHDQEDLYVLEAHETLKKRFPNLLTCIAPRHPHKLKEIEEFCTHHRLSMQRRTRVSPLQGTTEVYIVDTLGELGLFFKIAPVVFMGGSLVNKGGHNIIEPAHFGCAILQGPFSYNFRETTSQFVKGGGLIHLRHPQDLAMQLGQLLHDKLLQRKYGLAAQDIARAPQPEFEGLMEDITAWIYRND